MLVSKCLDKKDDDLINLKDECCFMHNGLDRRKQTILTRTEIEVNSPAPQQQEDKYIRACSLGNKPLTGAQLDASLNSAH